MSPGLPRRVPTPPAASGVSERGRAVGETATQPGDTVSVLPTARAMAVRRADDPEAALEVDDLRVDRAREPADTNGRPVRRSQRLDGRARTSRGG